MTHRNAARRLLALAAAARVDADPCTPESLGIG